MALDWLLNLAHSILLGGLNNVNANGGTEPCDLEERGSIVGGGKREASYFRMPLHYPRYVKSDYEKMEEWRVDALLQQYGIEFHGSLEEKRRFAMGAFLWPHQF